MSPPDAEKYAAGKASRAFIRSPLGGLLQSNRRLLYGNLAVGSWFPLPFRASRCGAVSSLSQRETRGQTERFLLSCAVARLARVVAVDVPHHVTQRGNARQYILDSDADRMVSLDLLRRYAQLHELSLVDDLNRKPPVSAVLTV